MNAIIAAFIIACSNLGPNVYPTVEERVKCIQRVTKCAENIVSTHFSDNSYEILKFCAGEVHL